MKCPLFILNDRRAQFGEETEIGDCIGAGCAWYVAACDNCAVEVIPVVLSGLASVVEEITQLLPRRY